MRINWTFVIGLFIAFVWAAPSDARPAAGSLSDCDDARPPIVFVHGLLASGDTWTTQIQRFSSNNICSNRLFAWDWNSLGSANVTALLDAFIDSVRLVTGSDKIHLVGHSAGGGRGYTYLSDPVRAAKVLSYAHIGSSPNTAPAGPGGSVPTINIYSTGDKVVNGADIPGAENVQFTEFDHYQVATSAATFAELYRFFYGEEPQTTAIIPTGAITIGGRCVSLGENVATAGAQIDAYTASAAGDTLAHIGKFMVGPDGNWGPMDVQPNQGYIFRVTGTNPNFRNVIYYYEPFIRDNPAVYLRTFPPPTSLAGILLSGVPNNDQQSVISIFSSSQAVLHGRDELTLDQIDLATPTLASESASMIALFCYDNGNDGQGNGEPMATFAAFPFLQGADVPILPTPEATLQITFNGRTMPVRNWRAKSDGVVIAVFNEGDMPVSVGEPLMPTRPTLLLHPNPARDWASLRWPGGQLQPGMVQVYTSGGQPVAVSARSAAPDQILLDLRGLPAGPYVVTALLDGQPTSLLLQLAP